MKKNNRLNAEEKRVMFDKGTESPFTNLYCGHFQEGVYLCRNCGEPLYRSSDKFHSGCGWPAFDDAIPGAVLNRPDADGMRTEIVCKNCGVHLGHIFTGENLTGKNIRHCVNSVSLSFRGCEEEPSRAVFAGGCFWGVEYYFRKEKGVLSVSAGYAGGHLENPSYQEVCCGNTGHYEAVEVIFDPSVNSYEELLKLFFQIHDFTQADGQGPDIGPQYMSAVFYNSEAQKRSAEDIIRQLRSKGYSVATKLLPLRDFWKAEEYHQDYYSKKRQIPYCHKFRGIF